MKLFLAVILLVANLKCSAKEHFNIQFITASCIKPLIDYHYLTCNRIVFKINDIKFSIEEGFETDLASIPKIAWPVLSPFHSSLIRPAIVHDWMYRTTCYFSRKQSDLIFYHMLINEGVSHFRASIMYYAVRFFGWNYYEDTYCDNEGKELNGKTKGAQIAFINGLYKE